jgi:hypothetical protein
MGNGMVSKEFLSRKVVNQFVIGYYALYVTGQLYVNGTLDILTNSIRAVVASYVLFLPATSLRELWVRFWRNNEEIVPQNYYHYRVYLIFFFLLGIDINFPLLSNTEWGILDVLCVTFFLDIISLGVFVLFNDISKSSSDN